MIERMFWRSTEKLWEIDGNFFRADQIGRSISYHSACLTPSQIGSLLSAEQEASAQICETASSVSKALYERDGSPYHEGRYLGLRSGAEAIRSHVTDPAACLGGAERVDESLKLVRPLRKGGVPQNEAQDLVASIILGIEQRVRRERLLGGSDRSAPILNQARDNQIERLTDDLDGFHSKTKPMGEYQVLAIAMDLATNHILEAENRGREERSLSPQAHSPKKPVGMGDAECNPRVMAAAKAMCHACYGEDLWERIPNQDEWILRAALAVSAADDVEWQPIEIAPEEEFWARNGKIVSLVKKYTSPEGVVLAGWGHKLPPTEWRQVPPARF
ncbi:hypothetical protein A0U91_16305 (plasmid) [Acetobacter persici]|uniref:Uncharacterized protein n=1 Tax=Acetobacter persici TaxID=1076596 RepID=A0A1U9LJP7_9PROT|nr:hypothetical protein A0U91_16305 [Acetobacter persici]